jgi:conjugal transfer pilus assembly protein TrbC
LAVGCWTALIAFAAAAVHAQAPPTRSVPSETPSARQPTDAEIERAAREHRVPSDAELDRVPIPSTPKVDALGKPARIDLESIARQTQGPRAGFVGDASDTSPRLQIFVTLTMPEPSLRALIAQAVRANAVLVLRGAKNASVRQTLDAVRTLIGTQSVAWQIDPPAFVRYGVTAAPTFVLTRAGAKTDACGNDVCMAESDFAKVSGDVSLDYALEAIARAAPNVAAEAEMLLARLRGRP